MATRYNTKTKPKNVVKTHEGGTGFKFTPEIELLGLLSTGIDNSYYEKDSEREKRLVVLIDQLAKKDPEFVAKALVYARDKDGFGQRTVTHRGAVALIPYLRGTNLGTRFFSKRNYREKNLEKRNGGIVSRLDDMLEILSCYFHFNKDGKLAHMLKRGFRNVIQNADTYELAKYKASTRSFSLVDAVNLLHPRPSEDNGYVEVLTEDLEKWIASSKGGSQKVLIDVTGYTNGEGDKVQIPALKALVYGGLSQFNTTEDKNTEAGKKVSVKVKSGEITKEEAEEELREAKSTNYKQLITERKIGYLALLRNLRNIVTTDTALIPETVKLLTDDKMISQSGVFPHQIDIAVEVLLNEVNNQHSRNIVAGLNKAYEISVRNVKNLGMNEHTAIIFDTSDSMRGYSDTRLNGKVINTKPIEKAGLIAATLAKGLGANVYEFGSYCQGLNYNPTDSVFTIKSGFAKTGRVGHGTNFDSIFSQLISERAYYQRLFVITDGQGHDSLMRGSNYQKYCQINTFGTPYVYYIDLCGYGTTMFQPDKRMFPIMGYSASIYETAKLYEVDYNALINKVKKIII